MNLVLFIKGQFRSYNTYLSENNKLVLTVFIKEVEKIQNFDNIENPNIIVLNGFICKQPIYRLTPFEREITDLLVAINRNYRKSDYIPCIAWGKNARIAMQFDDVFYRFFKVCA